ncbi:hypothetical protein BGY98DRAFT_938403 [Russula aff. rugulosa BPL654]|nr:hypothetical protein BGY98DRAFT_938403 [Russula aff. rugulosa BPL654]
MTKFYRTESIPQRPSDPPVFTLPQVQFAIIFPALPLVSPSNMHTFKFTLLAVLSYVAMIGATPLESRDDSSICSVNPTPPFCDQLCPANPGDPICSGYCVNNPQLQVCKSCNSYSPNQLPVCTGFCVKFYYLPACQPH